ncbi:MAG TPA: hypothetical protein VH540_00150 [Ktedonobacterales bacterium]|jgi:hypothetical protein
MLKPDTRLWQETLTTIALPVLFFGLGTLLFKGVPLWHVITGAGLFAFLRGLMLAVRGFKGLWRVEQRRQAAAKLREWVPLANPQPTADPALLPLPVVLSSNPAWLAFPLLVVLIWIVLVIGVLVWFWPEAGSFAHLLELSLAIALPVSAVAQLSQYRWIEVSEEGLSIRTLFRRQRIYWHEARLFAIDATVKTTELPNRYELSSATTILRWSREQNDSLLTHFSNSYAVYSQHMESLLALIGAQTSLPLYDLRDWELVPPPALPTPDYPVLWQGE